MPPSLPLARRAGTAALFPLGMAATSWSYLWRTTPFHRRELLGSPHHDLPPPLEPGDELLLPDDGVGPLFHRLYRGRIREAVLGPEQLIARLREDPNRATPTTLARFFKTAGEPGTMAVGDEYLVRMPGPWDGPVRVVAVEPTAFRLATLAGHLEAGQIAFRARAEGDLLVFEVESWARSADRLAHLLYSHMRMAKEVQFHMWTSVVEGAAELAGGRLTRGIEVVTRRVESVERPRARTLDDGGARAALDDLHDRPLNFEPREPHGEEGGWEVDRYCRRLPSEPPGPPVEDGSWEVARRLLRDYEFADPAIVRAVYRDDGPLEGRDMLLELRFLGLRFHAGVRVAGVRDETRTVDGREVRVWGWSYRTLQGHLEMGQMDYEVWKWLDDGEVEFRISRYSRPAEIRNPLVRLGFRLFGRREQVRFARRACERMELLVAAELGERGADDGVVRATEALLVE